MAKYFAGTRDLWACKGPGIFEWQTTVGSPARFDNSSTTGVTGAVGVSAGNTVPSIDQAYIQVPLMMDAASTTGTIWGRFDILPQASGTTGSGSTNISRMLTLVNTSLVSTIELVANTGSASSFYMRYWNGASYTQAGSVFTLSSAAKSTFVFRLVHGVSGTFDLWVNGTLSVTVSGLNAAVNNTAFMRLHSAFISPVAAAFTYFSQAALADFDLRAYVFPEDVLSAFGTYNAGTGTIAGQSDIDLNTVYTLAANGDKMTGTTAARTLPSGGFIRAVQVTGLERVNSPIANSKKMLRIGGTDYFSSNVVPAPTGGQEPRAAYWDTDPSTAAAWGITNYNSAEKGHQAVT